MMKGFELPQQAPGLSAAERQEGMELYAEIKAERQEASELLARLLDQADELGIDLDNEYDPRDQQESGRVKVRQELASQRAQLWLMLESNEMIMQDIEKSLGITRPHDA